MGTSEGDVSYLGKRMNEKNYCCYEPIRRAGDRCAKIESMTSSSTPEKGHPLFKPALLSLSLLTILTGAAIAPTLGKISEAFPSSSATEIQLILTLPSIFIMSVALLTGRLSQIVSKRLLLIIGLVVYLISGVAGGFATSIAMLLVTRSILGVAVGIITPLSVSLITDFYYGEERAQMMGYAQAARSLSGALTTPLIGLVAAANWRNIFWVYTLGLPVMLGVLWILPEPKFAGEKEGQVEKSHTGLPKAVWMFAIFMFLQRIAFYVMPANLSVYLLENEFGGSGLAGIAISVDTLASFMAGLFFAWLFKKQGRWMGMSSLVAMSCGYFALVIAKGTPMIFVSMALIGFGQGQVIPLLLFETAQAVPAAKRTSAIALVSSMQFLGQFITPFLFNSIGRIVGDSSIQMMFIATAVVLMLAVILQTAMNLRKGFLSSKS